jgi:ElaB/YqjD/DUF883 family membrane-anchored ribosome-binding protein
MTSTNEWTIDASTERSGFRGRLDGLRDRGVDKVRTVKAAVVDKSVTVRDGVQSSMRTHPMRWAGIAAGSGFVIGLAGRLMQSRSERRRVTPGLVILKATC